MSFFFVFPDSHWPGVIRIEGTGGSFDTDGLPTLLTTYICLYQSSISCFSFPSAWRTSEIGLKSLNTGLISTVASGPKVGNKHPGENRMATASAYSASTARPLMMRLLKTFFHCHELANVLTLLLYVTGVMKYG